MPSLFVSSARTSALYSDDGRGVSDGNAQDNVGSISEQGTEPADVFEGMYSTDSHDGAADE